MINTSAEASLVLTRYAPIWKVLFPETVRRSVAQLGWEVRWDGPKNEFAVVLDDTAIAEEQAKIKRGDQECANRPKPRRRKAKRRFAREVDRAITDFADYERPRHLTAARRVANAEQKAALRRLPVRERRQ